MHKYTLPDILSGNLETIESGTPVQYELSGIRIPMLQRDYAHGRPEESGVRNRFLNSIFEALSRGSDLELDFVYGAIELLDNGQYFVPLDGQQRLTLLFLLHWYIGGRELKGEFLDSLRSLLSRFSYATRVSAREFCQKLCLMSLTYKKAPSMEIEEAVWYYKIYRQDPTVASMLIVLDSIHERYQSTGKQLFPSLANIGFYILPLKSFQLTDELYIKMNARGKQLTDFENFKADFINWMQMKDNSQFSDFSKNVTYNGRSMSYHLALSLKLDNDWTRLFWEYTKHNQNDDKVVDGDYLRFWNRFLLHQYIAKQKPVSIGVENDSFFRKRYYAEDEFKYEGFEEFSKRLEEDGLVMKIENILDRLGENHAEINLIIRPSWNPNFTWKFFDKNITQPQRIIYFAVTLFLQQEAFNRINFQRWIRVVWNLAVDPDLRSIPIMVHIIRLLDKMAPHVGSIYSFLSSTDCKKMIDAESTFAKAQIIEESNKASLISTNSEWEEVIKEGEAHPVFMGNIGFLINDISDISQFKHRMRMANALFSSSGPIGFFKENYRLIRAVIASITTWDELMQFDFKETFDNWQLLLRRKEFVQKTIRALCDLKDVKEIKQTINNLIGRQSTIMGWSEDENSAVKARHIHRQLYQPTLFHSWLQSRHPTKAIELKWYEDRLYVHRPGSWYDRVMLDTYRNELITLLIDELNFEFPSENKRCGESNFYWDYLIYLEVKVDSYIISADFFNVSTLKVGIKNDGRSSIQGSKVVVSDDEDGWFFCKNYNFSVVNSMKQAKKLIESIKYEFQL